MLCTKKKLENITINDGVFIIRVGASMKMCRVALGGPLNKLEMIRKKPLHFVLFSIGKTTAAETFFTFAEHKYGSTVGQKMNKGV